MDAIVNRYLPEVNTHLPRLGYVPAMAKGRGAKPGPKRGSRKKGSVSPFAPGWPERLRQAMVRAGYIDRETSHAYNTVLAGYVGCTHQAIGQYLKGSRDSCDWLVLFKLCDELSVSPYYLALNKGSVLGVAPDKIPMQDERGEKKIPRIPPVRRTK